MSRKKMNNYDFSERLDVFLKNRILTIKDLAGELSVSDALINDMKNKRLKGPGIKFWRGFRSKYPEWESYLRGETNDPPIGSRANISRRDIAAARSRQSSTAEVNEQKAPYGAVDKYKVVAEVGEILDSGNVDIITALVKNVQAFKRAVDQSKRLNVCEEELKVQRKEIDALREQVKGLTAPPTTAARSEDSLVNGGT